MEKIKVQQTAFMLCIQHKCGKPNNQVTEETVVTTYTSRPSLEKHSETTTMNDKLSWRVYRSRWSLLSPGEFRSLPLLSVQYSKLAIESIVKNTREKFPTMSRLEKGPKFLYTQLRTHIISQILLILMHLSETIVFQKVMITTCWFHSIRKTILASILWSTRFWAQKIKQISV